LHSLNGFHLASSSITTSDLDERMTGSGFQDFYSYENRSYDIEFRCELAIIL